MHLSFYLRDISSDLVLSDIVVTFAPAMLQG